jgi:mono/diheme cytochrome c family protein
MTLPTSARVLALAFLLAACGGGDSTPGDQAGTQGTPGGGDAGSLLAVGAERYNQICITCHMSDGNGQPGVYPPLAGSELVNGDARLPIAIVLYGLQGPVTVKGETYNSVMQAWGMIPDGEIAGILSYVRSSFGNTAAPVTAADVAAIRASQAGRAAWTIEELHQAFPR